MKKSRFLTLFIILFTTLSILSSDEQEIYEQEIYEQKIYTMLMNDSWYVKLPTYAGQAKFYFKPEDKIPDTFVDIDKLIEYAQKESTEEELIEKLSESGIKFIDFRPFYKILGEDVVNDLITKERRLKFLIKRIKINNKNPFPFIFFDEWNPSKNPYFVLGIYKTRLNNYSLVSTPELIGRYCLSIDLYNSINTSKIKEIADVVKNDENYIIIHDAPPLEIEELKQELRLQTEPKLQAKRQKKRLEELLEEGLEELLKETLLLISRQKRTQELLRKELTYQEAEAKKFNIWKKVSSYITNPFFLGASSVGIATYAIGLLTKQPNKNVNE